MSWIRTTAFPNPLRHMKPTTAPTNGRLATKAEAAEHTQLSGRSIDNLMKEGTIPYYKIGRSVRFDLAEVREALAEQFKIEANTGEASA